MKDVSIVTIAQESRIPFLHLLLRSIQSQTAFNRIEEWIIYDGSQKNVESEKLKEFCRSNSNKDMKIKYCKSLNEKYGVIGEYRELSNTYTSSKTKYIVVMDDDDFQMRNRVKETLKLLKHKKVGIVGCHRNWLYHNPLDKFFYFENYDLFGKNHSSNCCYAYTKLYSLYHHYDIRKDHAEEYDFTNGFSEKMIQMSPRDCIIQMSYQNGNTYCKTHLCIRSLTTKFYNEKQPYVPVEIDYKKYMSEDLFLSYKKVMSEIEEQNKDTTEYDVVYYCGTTSIQWDYKSTDLGGSEDHIVGVSTNLAKQNKSVCVYGNFENICTDKNGEVYNGVVYKHISMFDVNKKYKNLILWRTMGCELLLDHYPNLKWDKLFVDLHDHDDRLYSLLKKCENKVDHVCFKTEFHDQLAKTNPDFLQFDDDKKLVIPNGFRKDLFYLDETVPKNKNKFIYASSYFRGLKEILKFTWPKILEFNPDAEFHLFYGMDLFHDAKEKEEIQNLINNSKNVIDHGKVNKDELAKHKKEAQYHLYPTASLAEIFCITLVESTACGCIPILSDINLYQTLVGVKIDSNNLENQEEFFEKRVPMSIKYISSLDPESEFMVSLKKNMQNNPLAKTWEEVANIWNSFF